MTITQGLVGAVSECCLGRREAADGGAAAAVVDGAGTVADGGFADVLGGEAAEAVAEAGAGPPADGVVPVGTVVAVPEAAGEAVPMAVEPDAAEPGASGAGPGVQAARADRPAPVSSSCATARRLGRPPDRAFTEAAEEQS
ncbi:hypothetical protein [Arthrobacter sp. QXT-31]|uniref:hypothetical protein n=1 Tax=Arthrobacter sp. QXT-31 TaxID=1357915 RepID=UPI0012FBE6FA